VKGRREDGFFVTPLRDYSGQKTEDERLKIGNRVTLRQADGVPAEISISTVNERRESQIPDLVIPSKVI